MTTQEKLIEILAQEWTIKIYARGHPPEKPQGHLPKHLVYTSEKEGQVFASTPFCVGWMATKGDRVVSEMCCTFEIFIESLYKRLT